MTYYIHLLLTFTTAYSKMAKCLERLFLER